MKDIQKIKEFFSRSLNETVDMAELEMTLKRTKKENPDKKVTYFFTKDNPKGYKIQIKENVKETTFKVGDKVTYLGHPAEITNVNKEITGAITYNVSYDKGNGKTKVTNIHSKDDSIKPIKEGNEEYYKPKIRKDKNNPNFLYIDIAYPADLGFTTALGSKTMSGRDREEGAAKALSVGNAVAKKLETKYNIEDIEVSDGKNGKVTVFAVSDDFIKMASPSLNEAKSNPEVDKLLKIINTKKGYNMNESKEINGIPGTVTIGGGKSGILIPTNQGDYIYYVTDDEYNTFINAGGNAQKLMATIFLKSGKAKPYKPKYNPMASLGGGKGYHIDEDKKEDKVDTITMDVPLFIRMLEYSREDAAEDMDLHDVTEKAISLGKERGILQMEDYDEIVNTAEKINEAEGSLKIEKQKDSKYYWMFTFKSGKTEKSFDGFNTSAEAQKDFMYRSKYFKESLDESNSDEDLYIKVVEEGIKVGDIVSKKYASTEEDYTKEFKVINITGMSATLQDTKTGKKVGIFLNDLTKSPMKEATTDYSKRRQAQDDYAINKKDKPTKPYNPTPSGKTDYMKRRQKEIAEAIIAKLKK